jgi:hypothetical protein
VKYVKHIPEVESAKQVMTDAVEWSVIRWLREKKRVRKAADDANAALDRSNHEVKLRWNAELKAAYESLTQHSSAAPSGCSDECMGTAKRIKRADEAAAKARADAEATFDEAERQLSTALAREGCRKAIHSWDLHEKALELAVSATNR